jgi:hypothetical protein
VVTGRKLRPVMVVLISAEPRAAETNKYVHFYLATPVHPSGRLKATPKSARRSTGWRRLARYCLLNSSSTSCSAELMSTTQGHGSPARCLARTQLRPEEIAWLDTQPLAAHEVRAERSCDLEMDTTTRMPQWASNAARPNGGSDGLSPLPRSSNSVPAQHIQLGLYGVQGRRCRGARGSLRARACGLRPPARQAPGARTGISDAQPHQDKVQKHERPRPAGITEDQGANADRNTRVAVTA